MNPKIKNEINSLMFNSLEDEGFFKALELQYGSTIPLFHATDILSYESIKKYGLKIMEGSNFLHFGYSKQLYFQIGRSDYVDENRSILLKYDAPIDFLRVFCFVDLDNVTVKDADLVKFGINLDLITSEMKDFLKYYIWNDFNIEGMEIMIRENDGEEIDIIIPERIL